MKTNVCLAMMIILMMGIYTAYTLSATPVRQHRAFWVKLHSFYAQNKTLELHLDYHLFNNSSYLMKISHEPPTKNK